MAKWRLYGLASATKFLGTVESDTEEEAIEKGYELDSCHVSICRHCAHEIDVSDINQIEAEKED